MIAECPDRQVECDNLPLAGAVLANQLYIVANAVDSHIACHGKGFEDIDLFVGNGESSRTTDFANDGYFILIMRTVTMGVSRN